MSLDSADFRKVIGNFASGVTVVTTDVDGTLHGLTANAVSSVSLEPLLILVCVDKGAVSHGQLEAASHFGMSILSETQEDVSNTFARTAPPEQGDSGTLRGVRVRRADCGVPLIEGAVAWLACEKHEAVDAGDHTIFLGRVIEGGVEYEAAPLLYFRGGYRRLD